MFIGAAINQLGHDRPQNQKGSKAGGLAVFGLRGARVSTSPNLFHGIFPPRHNSRATRLGDPVFFSEIFGRTPLCAPSKWCRMATQALPRIPVGHPQGSISCHSRNGRRARMLSYLVSVSFAKALWHIVTKVNAAARLRKSRLSVQHPCWRNFIALPSRQRLTLQ